MSEVSFQDKLYHLACDLFDGTVKGTIQWSETAEEDSFRTVLNTGLVRIEREVRQQPYVSGRAFTAEGSPLSGGAGMSQASPVPAGSLSGGDMSGGANWGLDQLEFGLL